VFLEKTRKTRGMQVNSSIAPCVGNRDPIVRPDRYETKVDHLIVDTNTFSLRRAEKKRLSPIYTCRHLRYEKLRFPLITAYYTPSGRHKETSILHFPTWGGGLTRTTQIEGGGNSPWPVFSQAYSAASPAASQGLSASMLRG
jgi:hypothetical protein